MNTTKEMVTDTSLYDYLGRPAGPKLGLAVAKAARTLNQPHTVRQVNEAYYQGPINEYAREFLDVYFTTPNNKKIIAEDRREHEKKKQLKLPF